MSDWMYNAIGLIGPVAFMWAYGMVSLGYWDGNRFATHLVNFIGAASVLVSLIRFFNLPVCVLEVCWASISVYGMVRVVRLKRRGNV